MTANTVESAALDQLAAALGVRVLDAGRWREALTHSSWVHEHPGAGRDYERLEFLGDALLAAATAQVLMELRPTASEGELSFLRSLVVRRDNLADWASRLPLEPCLRLGKGAARLGAAGRASILADVAEALLAVVHLEHGWEALVAAVAAGPAADIPDYEVARLEYEPKSVLQERLVAAGQGTPQYDVVEHTDDGFHVRVRWGALGSAAAHGRNRREAESAAARRALDTLERIAEART